MTEELYLKSSNIFLQLEDINYILKQLKKDNSNILSISLNVTSTNDFFEHLIHDIHCQANQKTIEYYTTLKEQLEKEFKEIK